MDDLLLCYVQTGTHVRDDAPILRLVKLERLTDVELDRHNGVATCGVMAAVAELGLKPQFG